MSGSGLKRRRGANVSDIQKQLRGEEAREPGAYIGNRSEADAETIPGGIREDDERVAANDSQSTGSGKLTERVQGRRDVRPAGHRDGEPGSTGMTDSNG
jgi:hypothetical protein